MSLLLIGAFLKRWGLPALAALALGIGVAYCHHRDTGLVRQGVNQERTRQADSVITVTETTFVTQKVVLAKALSHRDSQLIATRFELANAINEKPIALPDASRSEDDYVGLPGDSPNDRQRVDSTLQRVVTVCNAQIADDSTALAAALSALRTCGESRDAWKAKALIVQPQPSRLKPFVAGVVTGMAALAAIIHFVK